MQVKTQTFGPGAWPVALFWIAGIAITLFCAAAIAALMGWIPTSMGSAQDSAARAAPVKPALPPAVPPASAGAARAEAAPRSAALPAARTAPAAAAAAAPPACAQCGVIESTRVVEVRPEGSGIGAVGGAVVGGILGNQVGGGRGREVATVAGAVGGVVVGNEIEKRMKTTSSYEVTVRLEDGSLRVVREANPPAWRTGQKVKVVEGAIIAN